MQIEVVTDFDRFQQLKSAWCDLLPSSATNTIFQTFEWHLSWWQAHGSKHAMLVLVARDDQRVLGIGPFMIAQRRVAGRKERVLGFMAAEDASSDYCDFIVPAFGTEIIRSMLACLISIKGWNILELSNIPESSPHRHEIVKFFRSAKIRVLEHISAECPTLLLGDKEHTRAVLNKKSLKRHTNWFKQNGALDIQHITSGQEASVFLDEFFDQHIGRRASTETPSLFLLPAQREFYRLLAKNLSAKQLKFTVVAFNGEPIAFHFGFVHNDRFIWYKPSFSMQWAQRSPGEVLLRSLLELAITLDLNEFDFTVGNEAFKLRFANHLRKNYRLRVYRSSIPFLLDWAREKVRRLIDKLS